jgi:hypothetical protein
MYSVVTSRFDNNTLLTNYSYREKNGIKCIYCAPTKLSPKILYDSQVFVIEMNNSTNKIEGVGLIKNRIETQKYYKVHSNTNTNRYTYVGKNFIDRNTIAIYNPELINILDHILFKGKTHSKRGSGLSTIPEKVLKFDICKDIDVKKELKNIFDNHFRDI